MIPSGVQVFVALEPVDMRWSFDRLAGAALERIGYDARSGALFIYFGRRRDAVKILFFDGSVTTGLPGRHVHRYHRLPGSQPVAPKRTIARGPRARTSESKSGSSETELHPLSVGVW